MKWVCTEHDQREWCCVKEGGYEYHVKKFDRADTDYSQSKIKSKMNFGEALQAAKGGKKIQRDGWNGKGQFIVKAGGYSVALDKVRPDTHFTKEFLESQGASEFVIAPHLDLWNAQKVYVPGWAPSQGDLFAEDWSILD